MLRMPKKHGLRRALEDGAEIHEPDSLEGYSGQCNITLQEFPPSSSGGGMNCLLLIPDMQ